MTRIYVKLTHPDAQVPIQSDGDVGFDIYACKPQVIKPRSVLKVDTGLELADEPLIGGSCVKGNFRTLLKIEGRSKMASKGVWPVGGIIDPGYRGEICPILFNSNDEPWYIEKGHRVAQLVWYPVIANWHDYSRTVQWVTTETKTETSRGAGGFGSTGQ